MTYIPGIKPRTIADEAYTMNSDDFDVALAKALYYSPGYLGAILENDNLSESRRYDILSDSRFFRPDVAEYSPGGPDVGKATVTNVGEQVFDSAGKAGIITLYVESDKTTRYQAYTGSIAGGDRQVQSFGGGTAFKVVQKLATDISYKFCVFTDPNGTVSSGWNSPASDPQPLAWDGSYLWHGDYTANYIYKLKTDGSIVTGWNPPAPEPQGLAWDGTYLWSGHYACAYIYKLKTDGSVVSGWNSPAPNPNDLTWDGAYLWNADTSADYIYKLKTDGSIVGGWSSPGTDPFGLAWDGTYLWNADIAAPYIYKLKTSGEAVGGWNPPAPDPYGIAWDGCYLWDVANTANYIYRLSGGTATYTKIADLVY